VDTQSGLTVAYGTIMNTAPALFISHGAPTFALEPGLLGPKLADLGQGLGDVKALLAVSPHWQTTSVAVMTTASPRTLHDFGGFPSALYQIQYPACGHPSLAAEVGAWLADAGCKVHLDDRRGLDHGAWVPLRYLAPEGRIPVFQVSLPNDLDAAGALRLGNLLAPWREQGVAIVGSGSLTHNLYEFRQDATSSGSYAQQFTRWVREAIVNRNTAVLVDYRREAPHAQRAHPTEEHFLPLLVALGASNDDDAVDVIEGGMTYRVLSMESYAWGARLAAH
jgi:4,5-DOPA dioxygenase extradiol